MPSKTDLDSKKSSRLTRFIWSETSNGYLHGQANANLKIEVGDPESTSETDDRSLRRYCPTTKFTWRCIQTSYHRISTMVPAIRRVVELPTVTAPARNRTARPYRIFGTPKSSTGPTLGMKLRARHRRQYLSSATTTGQFHAVLLRIYPDLHTKHTVYIRNAWHSYAPQPHPRKREISPTAVSWSSRHDRPSRIDLVISFSEEYRSDRRFRGRSEMIGHFADRQSRYGTGCQPHIEWDWKMTLRAAIFI